MSKLIYRIGSEAGFFSEYNNMLLAYLYCCENNIDFELFSYKANFSYSVGWNDYFIEFCKTNTNKLNLDINDRQPKEHYGAMYRFKRWLLKFTSGADYLTSDLWLKFHNHEFEMKKFQIQKFDINNFTTRDALRVLNLQIWRFNDTTASKVASIISELNLPNEFVGIHIRRGDKKNETSFVSIDTYINMIKNINTESLFVATDDYEVVRYIRDKYPAYKLFTLCKDNKVGYNQDDFSRQSSDTIRSDMYELFATIEILKRSETVICTFSSNIGMHLGYSRLSDHVKSVDIDNWTIC